MPVETDNLDLGLTNNMKSTEYWTSLKETISVGAI